MCPPRPRPPPGRVCERTGMPTLASMVTATSTCAVGIAPSPSPRASSTGRERPARVILSEVSADAKAQPPPKLTAPASGVSLYSCVAAACTANVPPWPEPHKIVRSVHTPPSAMLSTTRCTRLTAFWISARTVRWSTDTPAEHGSPEETRGQPGSIHADASLPSSLKKLRGGWTTPR